MSFEASRLVVSFSASPSGPSQKTGEIHKVERELEHSQFFETTGRVKEDIFLKCSKVLFVKARGV